MRLPDGEAGADRGTGSRGAVGAGGAGNVGAGEAPPDRSGRECVEGADRGRVLVAR